VLTWSAFRHWYLEAGLGDALHEMMPLQVGPYRQGPFEFELSQLDAQFADWSLRHHALGSFTGMAFQSAPAVMSDFAARNVELSTSPDSSIVKTVTAQLRDVAGIDVLRGKVLRRIESTIVAEQTLDSRTDWFDALADVFHLPLADATGVQRDQLWRRVCETHNAWLATRSSA
jgi:N-hydroxyarylamine O-acetyltransferase